MKLNIVENVALFQAKIVLYLENWAFLSRVMFQTKKIYIIYFT